MKSTKPLKVGFDLDGVLLYNPARIARPIIEFTKVHFLNKKRTSFYIPKSKTQTFLWDLLHRSSLFPAKGIDEIEKLVKEGKIEAYIITARFKHLENNTQAWFDKLNKKKIFKKTLYNQNDQQAHEYKLDQVKKLKLDIFVDDNWNIVQHLNQYIPNTSVYWVSNLIDYHISYSRKHPNLESVLKDIRKHV